MMIGDVVLCSDECVGVCSEHWCALADDMDPDEDLGAGVDLEHLCELLVGPRTTTARPDARFL